MTTPSSSISRRELANAIRFLSMDAVQQANSGHPGAPMGMADIAQVLWCDHLKHNPNNPHWPDRDRFVLSNGHGSMLLYALLYLTGYPGITLEDIKRFRQLGSPCAGHPEYGHLPGVETTTGPLGQGFANGVGMALAERFLRERFGKDAQHHHIFAIVSDGDLMEGIASEAASLAGHLRLSRLVYLYDDNDISLDGPTSLAFKEDTTKRFEAYGWHVEEVADVEDLAALEQAIDRAVREDERPSLVRVRSIIGYPSPNKQGTSGAHGSPLGEDEVVRLFAARGGEVEVCEGELKPSRLVLLRFPDRAAIRAFLDDPDYRPLAAIRHESATSSLVAVDGL